MAGLSSNWKKLQEQLKAESTVTKPGTKPQKRKAEGELQSQTRTKITKTTKTATTKAIRTGTGTGTKAGTKSTASATRDPRKMGAVQSSAPPERAKSSISPSLSMWAHSNKLSAEEIAEAYDLGIKGKPVMMQDLEDKCNQGLTSGLQIGKYVAMDCEMVGIGPGGHESALARVSLVDFHGQQIYDSFVKPKERVTDWRTPVSGISQKEMRFARDFEAVQKQVHDVLRDRVLVGHDLKHDLEALQLSHPARDIRDTAKYPAFKKYGHGRKPGLKILAREILGVEIQQGAHSSTEDARAAMLLFRKHKCGFDVDHANRYPVVPSGDGTKAHNKGRKIKRR